MSRARLFVPLAVFAALLVVLPIGFWLNDPHELPSALVGKPFPEFDLPRLLDADQRASRVDLLGKPALVNVWATWCPTCRAEHEELLRLRRETGVRIIGVNYKDDPQAARRWLAQLGNPYDFSVVDRDGALGIDLGVYGAPETFIVDAGGMIRKRRVGEVNRRVWEEELAPILRGLGAIADLAEGGER